MLRFVYEQLRILAAGKLKNEPPGRMLQATALVHEAYFKLLSSWKIHGKTGLTFSPQLLRPTDSSSSPSSHRQLFHGVLENCKLMESRMGLDLFLVLSAILTSN